MTDLVQPQPARTQPEAAVVPAPPKPKKTGVVVLAVLVVLLLGAVGTLGALYVSEKNRAADLSKQVEEKQRALTAQTMLSQSNLEQMRKSDASAAAAQKELAAAKTCRDAAREVTAAGATGDQRKILNAVIAMMSRC